MVKISKQANKEKLIEPELRPEFVERMKRVAKEKTVKIGTLDNFRKRYGMK